MMLMLVQSSAYAQLLNVRIGSDALVEDAIKDAVVIVESNYCIQDTETNQKYGRNGKSYFNILQFLGCRTDKGIITCQKAIQPWAVDEMFDKYRGNNKYQPLLDSTLVVRTLSVDTVENISIASDLSFNNDSTLICTNVGGSRADGLMLSADNADSINWIVWVKNSTNKESKESPNVEFTITKKTVDFSKENVIVDTPNSTNSFIGGLYVSAKVVSVGLVEFSLSGFVVDNSGKWIVEPINTDTFSSTKMEDKEIASPSPDSQDDNLTPLKDNKKGKKKSKQSKKK